MFVELIGVEYLFIFHQFVWIYESPTLAHTRTRFGAIVYIFDCWVSWIITAHLYCPHSVLPLSFRFFIPSFSSFLLFFSVSIVRLLDLMNVCFSVTLTQKCEKKIKMCYLSWEWMKMTPHLKKAHEHTQSTLSLQSIFSSHITTTTTTSAKKKWSV